MSDIKTHYVEPGAVRVFGEAKVAYRIEVGIEACEPLKLKRDYPDAESDWLASKAADEGARMASEGFWYSEKEGHLFIPAHCITYVHMEKESK